MVKSKLSKNEWLVINSQDDQAKEMQRYIDSGQAWLMEGSFGRSAMDMIESGVCMLGTSGHNDYWGNYVPSRYEVKSGTKGSAKYCLDNMKEY